MGIEIYFKDFWSDRLAAGRKDGWKSEKAMLTAVICLVKKIEGFYLAYLRG
jgi:hypothetical protein